MPTSVPLVDQKKASKTSKKPPPAAIALIRGGTSYRTQSREIVPHLGKEDPFKLCLTPYVILSKSITQTRTLGYQNLHATPINRIIEIFEEASKIFMKKIPLTEEHSLSLEECAKYVTLATGIPITYAQSALETIPWSMGQIENVLKAMSPTEDLSVYDTFSYKKGALSFGWVPRGRNLGVVIPSNHPGVNNLWIFALALKYPILVKPSLNEPFTSHRIITSLYEAGIPEHSCHYLPLPHNLTPNLLNECDLSLIFGSAQTVAPYKDNGQIKGYGPGESKIIVDAGYVDSFGKSRLIEVITGSMMFDGGRSCINASSIIVYGKNSTTVADEIAQAVAENVIHEPALHPLNTKATIAAFQDADVAQRMDQFISTSLEEDESKDVTLELRKTPRLAKTEELTYLLPTVIRIQETQNRLLGVELPFPFITVFGVPDEKEMKQLLGRTLVLALITDDLYLSRDLLALPEVGKVYVGELTCAINAAEPHDGLLSDFLFLTKAYREGTRRQARPEPSKYVKLITILTPFFGIPTLQAPSEPLHALVYAIVGQRTRDETITERVSKGLFQKIQTIKDLASLSLEDLEQLLDGVSYKGQKVKSLKALGQHLLKTGKVPDTREELLQLPGVGEKTVSSALAFLEKPEEPLSDSHMLRVCSRLGIASPNQQASAVQQALRKIYADQDLQLVDRVFRNLGKKVCTEKEPRCSDCPARPFCEYYLKSQKPKDRLRVAKAATSPRQKSRRSARAPEAQDRDDNESLPALFRRLKGKDA